VTEPSEREELEHLERLDAMLSDDGGTWDLSSSDIAAINFAVGKITELGEEINRLRAELTIAREKGRQEERAECAAVAREFDEYHGEVVAAEIERRGTTEAQRIRSGS
jgi:hypothetical protein